MFSYRHAFHAGNHADVLKHTVLIALVKYLTQKDAALTVIDTHAGAGLYRLDGDYTETGGEAKDGVFRLFSAPNEPAAQSKRAWAAPEKIAEANSALASTKPTKPGGDVAAGKSAKVATATIAGAAAKKTAAGSAAATTADWPPILQDYAELLRGFNPQFAETGEAAHLRIYPGSPFIIQQFLAGRDKLKLFELHPTDFKSLTGNIEQLGVGRQVAVAREDGFEILKTFLPPPARRALVVCDPSYEIKSDYLRVQACMQDAMKRFATGTYAVWYPIIPRAEAHDLPRKLKTLAVKAGKSWLNASLTVKSSKLLTDTATGKTIRPGLPASGMFIINPPHTLKAQLQAALPHLVARLAQDRNGSFALESGG
jgi:23S rRNA (adenine2030-N6)-methyltransferase